MHCIARIDSPYVAPTGVKGGNDFHVKTKAGNTSNKNLHSIWDQALVTRRSDTKKTIREALLIQSSFPRDTFGEEIRIRLPYDWAVESYTLGAEQGYLNGELEGISDKYGDAPVVPDGYLKVVSEISERQAALAGYRLAGLLNDIFRD